jgi:uncharacterized protein YbjT (DUF2867 family)
MILVTGATGTVGRELVAQLVGARQQVRALTRNPAKMRFAPEVEVVTGDLAEPTTLSRAVAEVDRIFSLSQGPDVGHHETNLAHAARQAGVKHIVKLSVLGAGTAGGHGVVGWHERGEKAIQDSGASWTFVRPGMFMSNALNWAPAIRSVGKVFLPYGDGKVVPIHPRDIASVAAKALTEPGHESMAYSLTGAQALGAVEMMAILSEAVGKPIAYVSVSDEAASESMLKAGLPPVLVRELMKLAGGIRRGEAGTALPTIEQVLGRKALTWRDWANENAAAFR